MSSASTRHMEHVLGAYVLPEIEQPPEQPQTNQQRLDALEKQVDERMIRMGLTPPDTEEEDS